MSVSQLVRQVQRDKGWTDTKTLDHLLDIIDRWDEELIISRNDVNDMLGTLKALQSHKGNAGRKRSH